MSRELGRNRVRTALLLGLSLGPAFAEAQNTVLIGYQPTVSAFSSPLSLEIVIEHDARMTGAVRSPLGNLEMKRARLHATANRGSMVSYEAEIAPAVDLEVFALESICECVGNIVGTWPWRVTRFLGTRAQSLI